MIFCPTNQHRVFYEGESRKEHRSAHGETAVHNATQVQNLGKLYLKTAYPRGANGRLGVISWPSNIRLPKHQASGELRPRDHDGRHVVFWMHAWRGNSMSNHESNIWHTVKACQGTKSKEMHGEVSNIFKQLFQKPLNNWIGTAP